MSKYSDDLLIATWRSFLSMIEETVSKAGNQTKKKLLEIKESAMSVPLTDRQREGIRARCDDQIMLLDNPELAKKRNANISKVINGSRVGE